MSVTKFVNDVQYCLTNFKGAMDVPEEIMLKLACIPPTEELTFQEKRMLRDRIMNLQAHTWLLENQLREYVTTPKTHDNIFKRLLKK